MSNSSTKYLDDTMLDDRGLVVKEVMMGVKDYCGLFAFVLGVSQMDISDGTKVNLINNLLNTYLAFIEKKYEANLQVYNKLIKANPKEGKRFNDSVVIPNKLQEDYELGIQEAKRYLLIEIRDILRVLNSELEI